MSRYDMLCENCGVIEIEHSIFEDHPEIHRGEGNGIICGGKLVRYFGSQRRPTIKFISTGGGVDDWASHRLDRQPMTSVERETPYE